MTKEFRPLHVENFYGSAVAYLASDKSHMEIMTDFEVNSGSVSIPAELRASRQRRRKNGKQVRRLRAEGLHDELCVIFGPEMSAENAVKALRRLALTIEREGLLIGMDQDCAYVHELPDKKGTWLSEIEHHARHHRG